MLDDRSVADRELERVRKLARVLDTYLLDPLLGTFLPGIGDIIGSAIGLYIVGVALRRRISPVVVARMILNLGLDAGIGALPVIGDAFDFRFHANEKNVALLEARSATGGRARRSDWLVLGAAVLGFLTVVALVCWAIVWLIRQL
jgi:hypothetical protein